MFNSLFATYCLLIPNSILIIIITIIIITTISIIIISIIIICIVSSIIINISGHGQPHGQAGRHGRRGAGCILYTCIYIYIYIYVYTHIVVTNIPYHII